MGPIRFCAIAAFATSVGAALVTSANAADEDGCCQDLEQRVAELEAATARKGNRKVSLEVYGQVNRALYLWDDNGHNIPGPPFFGPTSDAYVVDNNITSTRLGVRGEGPVAPEWKSGFNIEFEFVDGSSNQVSQFPTLSKTSGQIIGGDEGGGAVGPINTRKANWYVKSDQYGRVTLGQQDEATKDITIVNLSGGAVAADARVLWNGNFIIRGPETGRVSPFRISDAYAAVPSGGLRWNQIANGMDSERAHVVRYDSPPIAGFILSASWGESVMWDVALRYAKDWNSIRVAAGVGYWVENDAFAIFSGLGQPGYANGANARRQEIKGSFSVMHMPTGLYVSLAAGDSQERGFNPPDATFIYVQGGIDKRLLRYGSTTLFGEYGNYNDFGVDAYGISGTNLAGPVLFPATDGLRQNMNSTVPRAQSGAISSSKVNRWGFGAVQKFDSAALEIYALYEHWNADLSYWTNFTGKRGETPTGSIPTPTDGFDGVTLGGRVKF